MVLGEVSRKGTEKKKGETGVDMHEDRLFNINKHRSALQSTTITTMVHLKRS